MPLRISGHLVPPRAAVQAAAARARERLGPTSAPGSAKLGLVAQGFDLALPHHVYDLGIADVAAGRGLEAARETGERYLVMSGDTAVAAAEVPNAADEAEPAQLNVGGFAQATAEAVRVVEGLDEVKNGSFELRVLRIAALHFMALWLRSDDARSSDRVVVLPPLPASCRSACPTRRTTCSPGCARARSSGRRSSSTADRWHRGPTSASSKDCCR